MITPNFQIAIKLYSADLSTLEKTLYLPSLTTNDGVPNSTFSSIPVRDEGVKLLSKRVDYSREGEVYKLNLSWDFYDTTQTSRVLGKTVGTGDGQIVPLDELYRIIADYQRGRLQITPGTNTGLWFPCYCTSELKMIPVKHCKVPANVEIEFQSLRVYPYFGSGTPV